MKQQTCDIIFICKDKYLNNATKSTRRNIAHYLSKKCDMNIDECTDNIIDNIIYESFLDFIDGYEMPSRLIQYLIGGNDITRNIINIFKKIEIEIQPGMYINGFNEDLVKRTIEIFTEYSM